MTLPDKLFTNEQIDLSALPEADKLTLIRLEPAYKWVRYLSAAIAGIVVISIATLLVLIFPSIRYISIPVFLGIILICIWMVIYSGISFKYMGYAVREKDITYMSGWLWKNMITVPFNRVQHCDIKQGLIDRQFGLSRLTIYTAGGESTDLLIPGLLPDTAERLKTYILHATEASVEIES